MSESRINSQIGQESLRARIWMGIIIFSQLADLLRVGRHDVSLYWE